jgi:gliding motility-associated-like protein
MLRKVKYILTIVTLFVYYTVNGQIRENLIRNGTFAGESINYTFPEFWLVCPDNPNYNWNDPNCIKKDSTTATGIPVLPYTDATLMRLRSHGRYYIENIQKRNFKETREFITQKLVQPLDRYTFYKFSIYLCFNKEENFPDFYFPNIAYPMKLNLLVSNDSCLQDKLLMETPAIRNTEWTKFDYTFNTLDEPFQYLTLQIQWDTIHIMNYPYNGMMLLDNARLEKICTMDTIVETVDYLGYGKTTLTAPEGITYSWTPKSKIKSDSMQTAVLLGYTDRIGVAVLKSIDQCPLLKIFNITPMCNNIYTKEFEDSTEIVYSKVNRIYLTATEGKSYKWETQTNLSSTTKRSPYLTGYSDRFIVTVTDKYNCKFKELFKIKIDCSLLDIKDQILRLDTLVKDGSEVPLIPGFGKIEETWNPPTFVECINCQETKTYPKKDIEYKVQLIDEYNCKHTEIFKVKIKFEIPNFISPNNDGYNDCFHISGLPARTTLKISDKTGKLIFSVYPYNDDNCWKGIDNNGTKVESGTYWYSIESPNLTQVYKGFIFVKH